MTTFTRIFFAILALPILYFGMASWLAAENVMEQIHAALWCIFAAQVCSATK
jgi:hypothetical protein